MDNQGDAIPEQWRIVGKQYDIPLILIQNVLKISGQMLPKTLLVRLASGAVSPEEAVKQHKAAITQRASIPNNQRRKRNSSARDAIASWDSPSSVPDAPKPKPKPKTNDAGAWSKAASDPDFVSAQRKWLADNENGD